MGPTGAVVHRLTINMRLTLSPQVDQAEKEVEWELKVDHAEKLQEKENEWDRKVIFYSSFTTRH